ncbi:DUF885 domain-containing protein [Luteimonas sp. 8-5]|uniref:DUF885 domain-containing protein n=1 Tax=Luteimonas sp. 8-5 TaxID=3039387 RepID=UPI0024365A6D|nr:DUF885 domain-containing protein [Luteimonas sp. 8-5]MDG6348094.1 DUF885 domain-containing protein [Luteimonas sp. 8-5]
MRALFLILAIVLGSTLPSLACAQSGNALKTLYTQEWQWRQHEFGYQTDDGEWKSGDRFPSVTPEAWDRRAAYWKQVLEQLDAIDVASLPHEEQVNAAVFRADIEAQYNNAKWRTYEAPFNSDSFFWSYLNPSQPYRDVADWRAFIGRLEDLPRYFDENIANMERGLARGWSVPRISVQGRERTLEPYVVAEGNPFLATFDAMPETIPADVRAALQAEGHKVVLERVVPAYRKLLAYLREDYLPNTRITTSASDLPDGAAFYQSQIREYVTLDMTAEQIHAMGLAEVARIEAEMREVMKRAGFEGTFQEFLAFLRTDPRFYAKTPRELMATAAWIAKKIDGQLKYTLGTLPRYRFTIIPVPDDIAPNYTSARGGLDACLFNTYDLPSRPLYNIPALVLHECAPGHSLQAALALEAPERPEFRQNLYFSGYGEGWGLYSEWLGTQMGVYETPYQDFGRLTMEMWRAARLVIDTGLHSKGWTRQQAIDYLASHTALAQLDIENEVDRYISWPGQALSYYIGYRTLRDLRAEAERELGARFDQKRFHDTILALGAVPLPVLEQEVSRFIAGQKAGP